MAILKLGEIVAGIRGTIGGTIYSANKSGPFARTWSRGSNPRTSPQTQQRAATSSHPTYWRALNQGQRDDWDAYAADPAQELTNSLGEAYYAAGFNWYVRINNHRASTDEARRDDAPVQARPAIPTAAFTACKTPITADWQVTVGCPAHEFTGFIPIVNVTFSRSTALIWKSRGFRLVNTDVQDGPAFIRMGLRTLSVFGDPILGSKVFALIQRQGTQGQRSAAQTMTYIVTAA